MKSVSITKGETSFKCIKKTSRINQTGMTNELIRIKTPNRPPISIHEKQFMHKT